MGTEAGAALRYSILDPTGNVTALVEADVPTARQPALAAALMRRHPEVEQVGFVRDAGGGEAVDTELRMAGGEFCGNATMSAAALWCMRTGNCQAPARVLLRVSGAGEPVEVLLAPLGDRCFDGRVRMPRACGLEQVELAFEGVGGTVGLVRMEGISHVVIGRDSSLFGLLDRRDVAERAVRAWCGELACDGLGLMFAEGEGDGCLLTPLVYVPGSDTVFWESSCASGSSAVGMWHAAARGAKVALELREPGGVLRVESDPNGNTWLQGTVELVGSFEL